MSASGNPDDTIIASNDTSKNVISARARTNLVIKGFMIRGAATDKAGIYLYGCSGCIIENNKFLDDSLSIYVDSSSNTTIRNNTDTVTSGKMGRGVNVLLSDLTTVSGNKISNHNYSIYFDRSQRNTVSGNFASQSNNHGIIMESSSNSVLENNNVSSNGDKGIYLKNSPTSRVKNNIVSSNVGNGIDLELSNGTTVLDNIISGNAKNTNIHGLFLNTCKDNYLENNTVSNCQYGVAVRYSENNSFANNNVYDNDRGFYISYSSSKITLSGNKANSNNNGFIIERGANNNIMDKNEVNSNSASGIALDNATNNKISNNTATLNSKGIYLLSLSSKNVISDNNVNSNKNDGIVLENASENNLTNNIVNSNTRYGIYLKSSNNSYIINNTAQNNVRGINLEGSVENSISENIATDCSAFGYYLTTSSNNTLSKNIAYNNGEGISLDSSENNEVSGNNVSSNGNGIYMCPRSYGNWVYNNYFNNTNNANIRNNRSVWNMEKTSGKNIMSGPTLGGNFWGSPALLGFSDINSDADGDGIIDISYVSPNGNVTDYYPLIRVILPVANFNVNSTSGPVPLTVEFTDLSQDATSISWDANGDGKPDGNTSTLAYIYEAPGIYTASLTASNVNGTATKTAVITATNIAPDPDSILPVASFTTNVTSGQKPLKVLFTDTSQNSISRSWDVNGDGVEDSNESSFVYIYNSARIYTATLTAINANGTDTESTTIDVDGGSSGGGGGGGGSPEPAKNVEVKELSQVFIANGKAIQFDFTNNATCVVYVNFDSKKTVGKTTTIVEQLKNKSTLVSNLTDGEVYKYFNVWVGNSGFASSENIENPGICFKVEKSWLQDENIDPDSITLNRYSNEVWEVIPANQLKEDSKYLYFTADVSGYSFFAVTGKSNASPEEAITDIEPEDESNNPGENDTESETEPVSSEEEKTGMPGFGMVCGIVGLSAAFLYRRK